MSTCDCQICAPQKSDSVSIWKHKYIVVVGKAHLQLDRLILFY
jgi:hypothetical protein